MIQLRLNGNCVETRNLKRVELIASVVLVPEGWIFHFMLGTRTANPAKIQGKVQKIEQENEKNAAQEHRNGSKDPKKKWEREVKGPQTKRPEIASPIHSGGDVVRSDAVVMRLAGMVVGGDVDEDASVAVIPYGLNVKQECDQEAYQYAKILDGERQLALVSHHIEKPNPCWRRRRRR